MNYDVGVFTRRRIISPAESYFAVPAGGAGALVPPDSIFGANLFTWWAADNPGGAFVEKALTRTAIGGGDLNLTAGGTTAPTVDSTGINGFPAYKFLNTGGGTGGLWCGGGVAPSNAVYPKLGTAGAVFAVVKVTASSVTPTRLFSMDGLTGDDTNNLFSWTGYVSLSATAYRAISNGVGSSNTASWTASEIAIIAWVYGSGNLSVYKNTGLASATALDTVTPGAMDIGNNIPGSKFIMGNNPTASDAPLDGWIGEMFVVNVTPSTPQLLAGYTYLHTKFALP